MGGPIFFKKVLPNCACSIGWCEVAARRHRVIAARHHRLSARRAFKLCSQLNPQLGVLRMLASTPMVVLAFVLIGWGVGASGS